MNKEKINAELPSPSTHGIYVFGDIKTIYDIKGFMRDVYEFMKDVVDFPEDIPVPVMDTSEPWIAYWCDELEKVFDKHYYAADLRDRKFLADISLETGREMPGWRDSTDEDMFVQMPFLCTRGHFYERTIGVFVSHVDISKSSFYSKFIKRFPLIGQGDCVDTNELPPALEGVFKDMEDFIQKTGFVPSLFEAQAVTGVLYDRFGVITEPA